MTLRELRKEKKLTQKECSQVVGVPLRTYIRYELDPALNKKIKYFYIMDQLHKYGQIDENNGILSLDSIKKICNNVLVTYNVEFCYLFGSYAKGVATPQSDVDLFVSTTTTGIKYFELVEKLKTELKKNVDVLDQNQIANNYVLLKEILKDGVKIYG